MKNVNALNENALTRERDGGRDGGAFLKRRMVARRRKAFRNVARRRLRFSRNGTARRLTRVRRSRLAKETVKIDE